MLSLENQWGIYKKKEADLEVQSPIAGEIVTWDVRNQLRTRPVHEGDALMRVADPTGPWQLELHMPENRMGHITDYQRACTRNRGRSCASCCRKKSAARWATRRPRKKSTRRWKRNSPACRTKSCGKRASLCFTIVCAAGLQPIAGERDTTNALRVKLNEAIGAKSYDDALAKLKEALPEVADADLKARFEALASSPDVPDDRIERHVHPRLGTQRHS